MATSATTTTVLDVPSLVSQLMSVERTPITKLQSKVTDVQSKISSFGTLKSLVSSLQSALASLSTGLSAYSTTSSDTSAFTATAGSNSVAGSYTLSVTSLASAQSLVAAGRTSSTDSITTGSSTVTFVVGGTAKDVTIGAGASLADIRDAINAANLGVSATVVNDGSGTPYRLALAATKSGTANAISSITVKTGGDDALNTLLGFNATENAPVSQTLTQAVAAADAKLTVNGIAITSASNTVTDAIQGVTLNLKNTVTSGTLTVSRDTASISDAVSKFVDAYNGLVSQLKSRSAFSTSTDTTAPVLSGDGTVRSILEQLRNTVGTAATGGTYAFLFEIGISVQTDSSLKVDTTKLTSALSSNFSDVQNLLTGSTGFVTRLTSVTGTVLQTGGLIDTRVNTLNSQITNYNDQIDKLEARMKILQQQYTTTYTRLNTYLGTMNSISTFLTNQLNAGKTSS